MGRTRYGVFVTTRLRPKKPRYKVYPAVGIAKKLYDGGRKPENQRRIKQAVQIPVMANGDITDVATARQALAQSGADGVMIGRGAQGRPWLLAQIAHALYDTPAPVVPQGQALAHMVAGHYQAMLQFYGADLGLRVARKHLGWYLDAAGLAADRTALVTETNPDTVLHLIAQTFTHGQRRAA